MFMKSKISLSIVLSVMTSPAIARACSVCFSGDDDAVTHAFNWSVGFLLAAPYAIAGTIATCLVIAYRRAAARRSALDEEQTIDQLILTQEESAK
jgi:hypothetical protein